jgi:hypothetical protein
LTSSRIHFHAVLLLILVKAQSNAGSTRTLGMQQRRRPALYIISGAIVQTSHGFQGFAHPCNHSFWRPEHSNALSVQGQPTSIPLLGTGSCDIPSEHQPCVQVVSLTSIQTTAPPEATERPLPTLVARRFTLSSSAALAFSSYLNDGPKTRTTLWV